MAAAFASCQKELCYDHTHGEVVGSLRVEFEWSNLEWADPSMMRLAMFRSGSKPVQVPFNGKDGGLVSLTHGSYDLIGYNSDTEVFGTRNDSWSDFEIYTVETELSAFSRMFATTRNIPRSRGTENELVVFEPEELWTSARQDIQVVVQQTQSVKMPMQAATTEYNFTINNVDNLKYVNEVAATLSGMSLSWLPAQGRPSNTHSIIPFTMTKDSDGSIKGTVRTFGHCPGHDDDVESTHMLTVYFELSDHSKYFFSFDVTEEMHDGRHWTEDETTEVPIVLDDIPLPTPITNGSGLHPNVTEWMEVPVEIDM